MTPTQLKVLTDDQAEVSAGLQVLDLDLNVTGEVELIGGTVTRNMNARVHGACTVEVSETLDWGRTLVRPYQTLTAAGVSETFYLGVFMLTTPEQPIGVEPPAYKVSGYDRLYLLDREVGDNYLVVEGTSYREALLQVFDDAELTGVLIDGSAADDLLPVDREWPLVATSTDPDQTSTPVTWLRIVNDLLTAINFRGVYADANGLFRCQRYEPPTARAPSFTFDAVDPLTTIVAPDRTVVEDMWRTPNRWVFIRTNMPEGAPPPAEGAGVYTVINQSDGPTSIDGRGMVWTKVYEYEAASQAALVGLGERRVSQDRRLVTTINAETGPFPLAGHADIFRLVDPKIRASKVQAINWEQDLLGGNTRWVWEAI